MLKLLDEILLSDNVVENFFQAYKREDFYGWINGILPEVEVCKNTAQDNPWHLYDCLKHILYSVEGINKQTKGKEEKLRRLLAYVMFLHDLGKPQCKIRRFSPFFKREVDSFFNHNGASVEIAKKALPFFNFSEEEQKKILILVDKHDLFMSIVLTDDGNPHHKVFSEEWLLEEIKALQESVDEKKEDMQDGAELMGYLFLIARADNLAQNPKLTGESLKKIDVMESVFNQL